MIERGTVVAVRGDRADVALGNSAACDGCKACGRSESGEMVLFDVLDKAGAAPGDEVEVVIPDSLQVQAAVAVYGVPLVGLFVGYLAGSLLGRSVGFDPDVAGALAGVILASIALAGTRVRERSLARSGRYAPHVRAILSRDSGRDQKSP